VATLKIKMSPNELIDHIIIIMNIINSTKKNIEYIIYLQYYVQFIDIAVHQ